MEQTRAVPVRIDVDDAVLDGDLAVPENARGLVIFVHGSGSSRFSSRNRYVAGELNRAQFATLLADLLTPAEDVVDTRTAQFRFDIGLLGSRTIGMIDWSREHEQLKNLPIGLFGASTGAAAAIIAGARRPDDTHAVVSRGGRVDLAGDALGELRAPLLMIVGGDDTVVLSLHRKSLERLHSTHELQVVPNASHLFEEPGALEVVAALARSWFERYLG